MKKISFLLAILMVFTVLFVGCKKDTDDVSSTPQNGMLSVEDVKYIDADGESVYRIVRPDGNNDSVAIATEIFKSMKSVLGVNPKNISDSEGTDDDTYEILLGSTNRPESALALEYLKEQTEARYNDFVICTIGKKIVINSKSIGGLTAAAEYFIENYIKTEGIAGGIAYTYKTEGDFVDITVNGANISEYSFVRPHFNTSYLTQLEIEKAVDKFYSETGHKLLILHDTQAEEADYEIVVGNCNRSGVEKIDNYDTYKITVADKKVYINGGSPYATAMAVTEFGKMVESGKLNSVEGSYNETLANYDKATTYHPTWVDDFDGDSINLTKWKLMDTVSAGKNGKKSVRSTNPKDVFVKDGCFNIWCRQDDTTYYGGQIRTTGVMTYKYGYVEESAIIPHGRGFWSSLWASKGVAEALADNQYLRAEIDINECFGNANVVAANMHRWTTALGVEAGYKKTSLDSGYSGQKKYYHPDGGDYNFSDTFHTYGYLWTPETAAFTCDGEVYFSYKINEKQEDLLAFHHELYLILSVACGLESDGWSVTTNPEEWKKTNKLIVDYVHIYQLDDGKHELNELLK